MSTPPVDVYLYDSDTGKDLKTQATEDITHWCPKANQDDPVILLFTKSVRGRIVQIQQPRQKRHIHFYVDKLDQEMSRPPRDDTFGSTAERLGLTKNELRAVIERFAPPA